MPGAGLGRDRGIRGWLGGRGSERVQDDADRGLAVAAATADGEDLAGHRLGRGEQPDAREAGGGRAAGRQEGRRRAASPGTSVTPAPAATRLSRTPKSVTLSLYLVPAVAIVISLVWLGQVPGPVELAGGTVALAGVILASTRPRRTPPAPVAGQGVRTVEPASVR